MTVLSKKQLGDLIEKYGAAPDFFDQDISDVNSRTSYGDQLIHAACVSGNMDDVALLLSMGADVNSQGNMGYTPLHYAVEQGHENIVALLLQCGADKLIKNSDGDVPLDVANAFNNSKITLLLQ